MNLSLMFGEPLANSSKGEAPVDDPSPKKHTIVFLKNSSMELSFGEFCELGLVLHIRNTVFEISF